MLLCATAPKSAWTPKDALDGVRIKWNTYSVTTKYWFVCSVFIGSAMGVLLPGRNELDQRIGFPARQGVAGTKVEEKET
jgi:hypothetical protein